MSEFKGVTFIEEKKLVEQILQVPTFTFTFTEKELATIHAVLGATGGSPERSPRGNMQEFFRSIDELVQRGEIEPLTDQHNLMLGTLFEKTLSNNLMFKDSDDVTGVT